MSLLNILLDADVAHVAVDTRAYVPGQKQHGEAAKMFPLVHRNAICAYRGWPFFGSRAFTYLSLSDWPLDELIERGGELAEMAFDAVRHGVFAGSEVIESVSPRGAQELAIVGWSEKHAAMRAAVFTSLADAPGEFSRIEVPQYYAAPYIEGLRGLVEKVALDGPGGFMPLARAQVALTLHVTGHAMTGGRLLLAEIRRDSMTISSLGSLDG